ncbi:MAG: protein phosphatase CheZ [Methylococcales bacterium]|nr:protein phosphatase CheZ [Methylococcales bacterium]
MNNDIYLDIAKKLVTALEQNDAAASDQLLDELAELHQSQLFKEVGRLTRQLHDTMVNFAEDSKISAIAEHDIPDAKERLKYVITMTEQAANQTLTVVETLVPISEELTIHAKQLAEKWERFLGREMPYDEFKALSGELSQHFKASTDGLSVIQSGLTEILMAQGFQDITGQIIRKVIDVVQDLEESMVGLIRLTGAKKSPAHAVDKIDLPGPIVPGIDDKLGDVANSQDDVDDLLSSLGF